MYQMIKGTAAQVLDSELISEFEINNVLIGEPTTANLIGLSIPAATLALPKEIDTDLTDRLVKVGSRIYRTVGYPEEGIEENVPLFWHKKFKLELLMDNTALTVYDGRTFSKTLIKHAFAVDCRGKLANKNSFETSGNLKAFIPSAIIAAGTYFTPASLIVTENCGFEFDTSSEQALSQSLKEFKKLYPTFAVIKECEKSLNAKLFDLVITAE